MASTRLTTRILALLALTACFMAPAGAQYRLDWSASTSAQLGSGDFAPYYITANTDGVYTEPMALMERAGIHRDLLTEKRFEYGFGASVIASLNKSIAYDRYSPEQQGWTENRQHQPYFWLQELWGAVKYRSLFLRVGMKDYDRSIFDSRLGSGDIIQGNNTRPLPEVRAGFLDFVDIPLTRGWVQIQGEIAYGKFTDGDWLANHYNRYNSFVTTGNWYHYKRLYLRTKPSQPFFVTVGMQHAVQFGGTQQWYVQGHLQREVRSDIGFRDFIDALVPNNTSSGANEVDQTFYNGNHLGSWDFRATYRLPNRSTVTAYFQWPWEDGSGIGKLNGWDGVWGLEYKADEPWYVDGVVMEYIDFTNQSGPMHFAPGDFDSTQVHGSATGADDYYNNAFYNGWTNYGLSLGSPFAKAPFYNLDGYMRYQDNRVRGFHLGISGTPLPRLCYRVLASYRTSWGTPFLPLDMRRHDFSTMAEASYSYARWPGLSSTLQIAGDHGRLFGNNFGVMLRVEYAGAIFKPRR